MADPPSAHPPPVAGRTAGGGSSPYGTAAGAASGIRRVPLRVWSWTACTVALVVLAVLLWQGSDAAATSSTTSPAAAEPAGAPAAALGTAWSAPSTADPGDPVVAGGRVLATDEHGVRLLEPADGAEAWHYQRSDARLCDATAVDGLVVAVFRTTGRCNEIVALEAGTGQRAWYRTVGFSADVQLTSTAQIVLAWTPSGLATIDPTGNNIRWRFAAPAGCRIADAAVGSAGVVLLQSCAGADTVQLRLLDGFGGEPRWSRDVLGVAAGTDVIDSADAVPVRLVGVDSLVCLVVGDALQTLAGADGAPLSTVALPAGNVAPGSEPALQEGDGSTTYVYLRGTVVALDAGTGGARWQQAADGLPASPAEDATATPDGAPSVLLPESGGFVRRDAGTGSELARSTVSGDVAPGGRVSTVGPVVVVAAGGELTAYR